MLELYSKAKEHGQLFFHKHYCLFNNHNVSAFDGGAIKLISIDYDCALEKSLVTVLFADGSCSQWTTKRLTPYNYQFGVAVSFDGKLLFVQTWENGLFCLDSYTGERIWKTKSEE